MKPFSKEKVFYLLTRKDQRILSLVYYDSNLYGCGFNKLGNAFLPSLNALPLNDRNLWYQQARVGPYNYIAIIRRQVDR